MQESLVSIIIPVYNAEKFLANCLDSCLNQTYTNVEVVAINDGSTDSSLAILNQYAAKSDKIIVINKPNQGVTASRKLGLSIARGKYISFLDSDDTIPDNAVGLLYNSIVSNNSDIAIGNVEIVNKSNESLLIIQNSIIDKEKPNYLLYSLLDKKIFPALCGKLYKAELFNNIEHPLDYSVGEDIITNILIFDKYTIKASFIDTTIYYYMMNPNSVTHIHNEKYLYGRQKYIMWLIEYSKKLELDSSLNDYFYKLIVEEYYTFLRDGGYSITDNIKICIKEIVKNNRNAILSIPVWRRLLVNAFLYNLYIGKILRIFIETIRKLNGR